MLLRLCTVALVAVAHGAVSISAHPLKVETECGMILGFINTSTPDVRQFLGVPFVLPPTGCRRWLPPAANYNPAAAVNATNFGLSCPQIPLSASTPPNVFTSDGGGQTEFFPRQNFSEDCLTLNIWAPAHPHATALPVIRTQAHIVVSVNFRSNIFGFPNAAGLGEQNLGLLDQRAGLEWVRANIGAFGGDPARIVAWGQSAGAIAADYLHFAFHDDPIVQGSILDSGTALFPQSTRLSNDTAQRNFAQVAAQLGCGGVAAAQIDCLRDASWESIEGLLAANASLSFLPVADSRVVFANYTAQYAAGAVARVPVIIGTNQHELNALDELVPGGNESHSDAVTNATFLCTAAETTQLRQAVGLTTYRYRYDGNFTNISPPTFPGAYHGAELPLIFGTAGQYHGASTPYEDVVSMKLQDLWLAFAQDPQNGLLAAGWAPYGAGVAVLLGDTDTPVKQIDVHELDDGVCVSAALG
ncbi:para-nitrobenzyl esterase [Mycena maculata]|uniref:Para-nitrobenzyl esterase n=1 Tax=Mycena maculata TaxID=230809 RepID=A0AAD7IMP1_9AGAR|nr:para-nitrobenzyl esterase [Mycena maculata]